MRKKDKPDKADNIPPALFRLAAVLAEIAQNSGKSEGKTKPIDNREEGKNG